MTVREFAGGTTGADRSGEVRRRSLRAAGIGGIGAFVAWGFQPVVVALLAPETGDGGPTVQFVLDHPFNGIVEALLFSGIGVGLLFLVLGTTRLVRLAAPEPSLAVRVGETFGIAGSIAWLFAAGLSLAQYTSVGYYLGEAAPDTALQLGLYQLLAVILAGVMMVYVIGFVGWLIMIGTAGRTARVVGWPTAVVALVGAAIMLAGGFLPFAPPWTAIVAILLAFVLGIVYLVKARRA